MKSTTIDYARIRQYSETDERIRGVGTGWTSSTFNSGGGLTFSIPLFCRLIDPNLKSWGTTGYAKGINVTIKYVIVADMNS